MLGLRLYEIRHDDNGNRVCPPRPSERGLRTYFQLFFEPILPQLEQYYWMWPSGESPVSWENARSEGEVDEFLDSWAALPEGWAPPGLLLPRLAKYLKEDWNDIYGTRAKPSPGAFFSGMAARAEHEYVAQHVELVFKEVDGCYWEFYAHEKALLLAVRQHVGRINPQLVEQITLSGKRRGD